MKPRLWIGAIGGALLGLCGAGNVIGQDVSYLGSVQYTSGSYFFTEETQSLYFNNGISFSLNSVNLSFNIPFIIQNSPWISYSTSGPLPTGGPGSGMVDSGGHGQRRGRRAIVDPGDQDTVSYTQSSFGDPSVSANIDLFKSSRGQTVIRSNVSMKLPVADPESGFGTGAVDFSTGLSLMHRLGSGTFLTLDGSYWMLGDMEDLDLKNPVGYGLGVGQALADGKVMLIANVLGSSQVIEDIDPPISTGFGMNIQVAQKISLNGNVNIGLSESSSDFGIGFGWYIRL